ncbi:MAG: hypothetical protein ACFFD6_00730 [Candidatus Thorarchaeota archaeon]
MAGECGLLRFILHLPTISKSGKFVLKDLPGSGQRIDVLCRSLAACFDWGPTIWPRMNLEIVALIEDDTSLRFVNPGQNLPRGEVAWASVIQASLTGSAPDYVGVERLSLKDIVIRELGRENSALWALEETGTPLLETNRIDPSAQNSFIIGNHRGFDSDTLKIFDDHSIYRLSLGRISYLTSHCVVGLLSHLEEMIH